MSNFKRIQLLSEAGHTVDPTDVRWLISRVEELEKPLRQAEEVLAFGLYSDAIEVLKGCIERVLEDTP